MAFCLTATTVSSAADDSTTKYFAQLRQRRLFSLAEGYCLSRLSEGKLSQGRRTQLTIELSRTLSEHARFTSGQEQTELWQRATAAIDELLKSSPQNPRRLLLQTQRALSLAAQGEHLRWQVELFPYDETLKPRAVAAFDQAILQLKESEKEAAEQLRKTGRRRSADADALSPYELRSLTNHLGFQIGQALVERAKLDPAGSPDRVATLMEAESWLSRLAKRSAEQALTLDSRLLMAESSRMRGDRKQTAAVLKSMQSENSARELLDRMKAVEARLMLDEDRATDAAQLLSRYRVERLRLPGELQYLQIEALSSLWAVAEGRKQDDLATQLTEQIEAHADRAEAEVGGFWAYRCRLLVETMRETKRYGVELATVVREARSNYSAGRIDEAVEAYGRAYETAERGDNDEIAMEIGYTRASVQLQSKNFNAAAEGFEQLANRFPKDSRAATAHLLSAYSLGRAYEQKRTKLRREKYTNALVRHRTGYPKHETMAEATWMLASLEERRLQVTRALKLYREIPVDHRRGPLAEVAVARCYEKILDRVRELERPIETWENDAIARLATMTSVYANQQSPLGIEQTEVCLRFARICLNRARPDYRRGAKLLDLIEASRIRQMREQQSDPAAETDVVKRRWKLLYQAATQLRIVTLAGGGRFDEAKSLIETLADADARDVLGILDGLSELTANADTKTRNEMGKLQFDAAQELDRRRNELKPTEQKRLDHCLGQAYVATGRSTEAIKVYESLLSQTPKDRRLLKTVAELLTDCGTRECLLNAKTQWRKLESMERAGEPAWMSARYQVVWCLFALKEHDECRKLLAVTRLLYPALGGDELRSRFAELEKKLPAKR
ncbi:MAG: outer membrane protein assembly factor BamD [Planctomycetaceae bacterium]|jgi:TolA-binding protein/tetratricopeptide (TPR) repeat protein|nr:outer membrane protein assembly factor BamD [Planctomycetaceae bacterium]MBT6153531.1 outer membrane protein assembly factor BamD [Planctomycetaceae bacterium]MBT6483088.1 outer membrane protein assembly factor BamD [Planctomycetaceae bacterium]MBT6495362.1 outer membrane protein assembly factor BamD [Planctomycetaceae bacterium]